MVKNWMIAIVLLGFAACAGTYNPKLVQHIKGSSFKATETGYYTAELVMKPKNPVVGKNKAHLIIHDYEATDIPGLTIKVVPYLPAKKLESGVKPTVNDSGRGLYIIEDIDFPEPGQWELKITITGPYKTDSVVLPVPEVTAQREHMKKKDM